MTTIRKVVIAEFGDADVVKVVDDICPPPPPGHVQIAVEYAAFTGGDVNMRKGIYPFQKSPPFTPGYSLVGTVRANGEGCKAFQPGDVVTILSKYDAEAQLCNQPEKYCIKVPDGVDHQQATVLPCDWNTAYAMVMDTAKVSKGQSVFIHGISGSVGTALMTLCKLQGAEVYGTASQRNHDDIRAYGVTPFVYTDKKWMDKMKELGGVHAVFDPLGFDSFDESFSILAPDGILVAYGNNGKALDGHNKSPTCHIIKMFARGLNPMNSKRTTFYGVFRQSSTYKPHVTTLLNMVKDGTIRVPIKKIWDLEDIQSAHREWGTGSGIGSLLIRIPQK
ncbi:GroES-like protein [Daldinia decipiens]|uniref:GroES-like protein n=1 Tax=Daldinia decipiens TaxID=326647 RepID=UPI0020C53F42|nr:GroES-like protein [Daldinia decipiens]KAI1658737.1 GroES-like protein [Daldinia decipiens]